VLGGAFTALVTPFGDSGEIDYAGLVRLLAWHEANGMDGVVVAGTNGEGPSLSAIEKRDLVRFSCQQAGNLKIIFGAGSCSLPEAVWLCEQGEKAGAAAALVLPPYYFSAEMSGVEDWFRRLIAASPLPIIVYNFPKTTGITLEPSMVERLLQMENCIGIKDSSGDVELLHAYLAVAAAHSKSMLVGDERLLLNALTLGGGGTISGLANSYPTLVARQVRERSEALQALIDECAATLKALPQPAVHKTVLDHRGLPGGRVRPPLEPLSADAAVSVAAFVDRFGM
jgi:4-hydroxy-tetrahydrodipicolinate synthase